ncbi:NAD(P)-binding domain-containing protein [Gemmatimonas sp.]
MFLLPFHVISCSHEANSADLVGSLRLSAEQVAGALGDLHRRHVPAVMLSTCHRTELYWWGDEALTEWFAHTLMGSAPASTPVLRPHFEQADADLAVRHLFAVASGMRSARFGEPEILGQLRRAWMLARDVGAAHGAIDGVFRYAIEAARHIRSAMGHETDASLGARVCQRLRKELDMRSFRDLPQIVVVGSGDAARSVLNALRHNPVAGAQVHVTSRTDQRAQLLADEFAVALVPWEQRDQALREADAVVFAVHVTSPLVPASFAASMPERDTPAVWVDLGVPGAVAADFSAAYVQMISLAGIEADAETQSVPWRAFHEARVRRANVALQQELARYARAAHRHSLGARLGLVEEQALAVASSHGDAPVDEMVRKVTRLVLRELSRA